MERRAGFWLRAAAASIDFAVGFAASVVLQSGIGMFFARRAVVTLRIGAPGTMWKGPLPLMIGTIGEVVYLLPFVLCMVWVLDPLTGATIGKRLLGLRVRDADGQAASRRKFWIRSAIQTAGLSGWTFALLAGRWEIAALASLAGGAVLLGCLLAVGPASLTLHDRLSRTSVCRLHSGG
jgi:uncharacterized RDD family membrane protein YckC